MRNLLTDVTSQQINLTPPDSTSAKVASGFSVSTILAALINFIFIAAAVVFFVMLVVGGVRWIASGGDKGQTEAARGQITAALVGLVIIFAAYAIAKLVGNFFGFDIFNLTLPGVQQGATGILNFLSVA